MNCINEKENRFAFIDHHFFFSVSVFIRINVKKLRQVVTG